MRSACNDGAGSRGSWRRGGQTCGWILYEMEVEEEVDGSAASPSRLRLRRLETSSGGCCGGRGSRTATSPLSARELKHGPFSVVYLRTPSPPPQRPGNGHIPTTANRQPPWLRGAPCANFSCCSLPQIFFPPPPRVPFLSLVR